MIIILIPLHYIILSKFVNSKNKKFIFRKRLFVELIKKYYQKSR